MSLHRLILQHNWLENRHYPEKLETIKKTLGTVTVPNDMLFRHILHL